MNEFFGPYVEFWQRYVDFSGVTSRRGFWMVVLVELIISMIIGVFAVVSANLVEILSSIYGIATLIPSIAICVRRLHDTNRSGLNLLWILLPIIGQIILIVYFCQPTVPAAPQETAQQQ